MTFGLGKTLMYFEKEDGAISWSKLSVEWISDTSICLVCRCSPSPAENSFQFPLMVASEAFLEKTVDEMTQIRPAWVTGQLLPLYPFRSQPMNDFCFSTYPDPRSSQLALVVKNPPPIAGDIKSNRFNPWVRKNPWRREWLPNLTFLPGEFHGQRSLAG